MDRVRTCMDLRKSPCASTPPRDPRLPLFSRSRCRSLAFSTCAMDSWPIWMDSSPIWIACSFRFFSKTDVMDSDS